MPRLLPLTTFLTFLTFLTIFTVSFSSVSSAQSLTHIVDTAVSGSSGLVTGSCIYAATTTWTNAFGTTVFPSPVTVPISAGVVNFALIPTDTATPGPQTYTVTCSGTGWYRTGSWAVPTVSSPATVKLSALWVTTPTSPLFTLPLVQLGGVGPRGTALCSNGASWGVVGAAGAGGCPGFVTVPSTSSSTCSPGQTAVDSSYFYACVATNSWKRAPLSTF